MRVCVTGGSGFLGQHVCRLLRERGHEVVVPRSMIYDLRTEDSAFCMLAANKPDAVIHLAAKCGGIGINQQQPASFFLDNLRMGMNVINECCLQDIKRVVVAGSICSYGHTPPRIPFDEDDLWSSYPERTNASYGVAKKALLTMLEAYRQQYGLDGCFLMPTNLAGPGDEFDPERSHVIPAIIRKMLEAKAEGRDSITLWGTGRATRDFLDVRDAAKAFVLAVEKPGVAGPLNLGSGAEYKIMQVAEKVRTVADWKGKIEWDESRPDGQPRRVLDSSRARAQLGWRAEIPLMTTLVDTVSWYKEHGKE